MSNSRLAGLDALRAAAVILVIGRHAAPLPPDAAPWLKACMDAWGRGGWVGVDLFFVLSGFLISGLLFREHAAHGRIDYGRFLIRRGFKIYPPFWVLIGVTAVLYGFAGRTPSLQQIGAELLYVQNYWPGYLPHTWSLAVEEHFYLLLPLLLIALARRPGRPFALLPLAGFWVALACLVLRCLTAADHDRFAFQDHLFPTHLRIDSLLAGVLLSWQWHCRGLDQWQPSRRLRAAFWVAGVLLLVPAFAFKLETSWFLNTFGLLLLWLGSAFVLLPALGPGGSRNPLLRCLACVGAHSYSIYLWHIPVRLAADRTLGALPPLCAFALYFAASIALGIAMSRLVEVPVLRFRDRMFPSRAVAAPSPQPVAAPAAARSPHRVSRRRGSIRSRFRRRPALSGSRPSR
jgi:peptidoglycan/LPS O-acetylase OafA/YrhL